MKKVFDLNADYQPCDFEFTGEFKALVEEAIARYPAGKQQSAVMPLLDLVQRQVALEGANATPVYGGWVSRAAMDAIAETLNMLPVKVYEVASFYSMYNTAPVGKYLVQFCSTTPCWLRGSEGIIKATTEHLGIGVGETSADGKFSLMEVECLGACVNAPMVQINDDYFEDLTPDSMVAILNSLADDLTPIIGSQTGRKASMPCSGATCLKDQAKKAGVA